MTRRRSPQEKKALSYARDRRNVYGENDKSSRKNIRRNKRSPNRADRHHIRQMLAAAAGTLDPVVEERAADRLGVKKSMWFTKRWRKYPDAPLAQVVTFTLRRRARLGMSDLQATEVRVDRVSRTGRRR